MSTQNDNNNPNQPEIAPQQEYDLSKPNFLDDGWFEAYLDNQQKTYSATQEPVQQPTSVKAELVTDVKPVEQQISDLEKEVAEKRSAFTNSKKPDKNQFDELDELVGKLNDLKVKQVKESSIKDQYRKQYASTFVTDIEFENLWNSKLRNEAIQAEIDSEKKLKTIQQLPLYSRW